MARHGRSFPIRAHIGRFRVYSDNRRYWVGGTGDTTDTSHWSYSTGGPGGAPLPGPDDDVFFDANSFSAGSQTVTLGDTLSCKSIDWTGVTNNPTLDLATYGIDSNGPTVKFVAGMTVAFSGGGAGLYPNDPDVGSTVELTTAGHDFHLIEFQAGTFTLDLQDALTLSSGSNSLYADSSQGLTTNNHNITLGGNLYLSATLTVDFGTSVVTAGGDIDLDLEGHGTDNLTAGAAAFVMTGTGYFFMNGSQTVGSLEAQDDALIYATGQTIGTLELAAGKTYTIDVSGATDTINVDDFIADGTVGNLITILSSSAGVQHTFSKASGTIICDYLDLTDSNAGGGATWYAGANSVDTSNNDGWIFDTPSETTPQTITGKARITRTVAQTQTGKARITATTPRTVTGKGRITATTTRTVAGVGRVTRTVVQTLAGLARLTVVTLRTATGKARITQTATQTQDGTARITIPVNQTLAGVARVTVSTTRTQQGRSRIEVTVLRTVTGVGRVTATASRTQQGIARITAVVSRTAQGLARVTATAQQLVTGQARIMVVISQTQQGQARISVVVARTVAGQARITAMVLRTQQGRARVTATSTQIVEGTGRLNIQQNQTVTGVARITRTYASRPITIEPEDRTIALAPNSREPITLGIAGNNDNALY